ncbi:MAG: biopolymer transporter ExbD [Planctomycetota bacterium]|nr:biopolymer transporter ExbD [Planctomycetota bacterium]
MIRSDDSDTSVHMDLTPIIDMVFLLLIFFLVATTFQQTEREMKIALPAASSAGPISSALRELIINIDVEGRIILNGLTVHPDELRSIINDAVSQNADQKVTIRGDQATSYANIVRVLDICKGAGIQEPYLDTVVLGTPRSGS